MGKKSEIAYFEKNEKRQKPMLIVCESPPVFLLGQAGLEGQFVKIAPYLRDPMVLIGFFLMLAFLFARYLIRQKIVPTLPRKLGYRILQMILLYGFLIGILLISLGFWLKHRELSEKEQGHALSLLKQEMVSNTSIMSELKTNTETMLKMVHTTATVLRTPGIRILPVLFSDKNLDLRDESDVASADLANSSLQKLVALGLHQDVDEKRKFSQAGRVIHATIGRTIATVESLADENHERYSITTEQWEAQLPILRKIELFNVTPFQNNYAQTRRVRTNYDIVVRNSIHYLEEVQLFFYTSDHAAITTERLSRVLAAERLAFKIIVNYSQELVEILEEMVNLTSDFNRMKDDNSQRPGTSNSADTDRSS